MSSDLTRRKIEQEMDAFARKYYARHDKKILDEILELSRRCRKFPDINNWIIGLGDVR